MMTAVRRGSDTNVPTWHSREYYSTVKTWGDGLNITYGQLLDSTSVHCLTAHNLFNQTRFKEDEGKPHWYPEVLDNSVVQQFFDRHLNTADPLQSVGEFTLTVSSPTQSGSLYGWTITEVMIPGRFVVFAVNI